MAEFLQGEADLGLFPLGRGPGAEMFNQARAAQARAIEELFSQLGVPPGGTIPTDPLGLVRSGTGFGNVTFEELFQRGGGQMPELLDLPDVPLPDLPGPVDVDLPGDIIDTVGSLACQFFPDLPGCGGGNGNGGGGGGGQMMMRDPGGGNGNGGGGGGRRGQTPAPSTCVGFQTGSTSARPIPEVHAFNPTNGKLHTWKHMGRPVLYSGDLATSKRVDRIAARARRPARRKRARARR